MSSAGFSMRVLALTLTTNMAFAGWAYAEKKKDELEGPDLQGFFHDTTRYVSSILRGNIDAAEARARNSGQNTGDLYKLSTCHQHMGSEEYYIYRPVIGGQTESYLPVDVEPCKKGDENPACKELNVLKTEGLAAINAAKERADAFFKVGISSTIFRIEVPSCEKHEADKQTEAERQEIADILDLTAKGLLLSAALQSHEKTGTLFKATPCLYDVEKDQMVSRQPVINGEAAPLLPSHIVPCSADDVRTGQQCGSLEKISLGAIVTLTESGAKMFTALETGGTANIQTVINITCKRPEIGTCKEVRMDGPRSI